MMLLIVEAAARALALALLTGILLWVLRVKNVAVQRLAWSVVLFAAFAMPAFMRFPWVPAAMQRRPALLAPKVEAPAAPITYTPPAITDLRLTTARAAKSVLIQPRPVARRFHLTPAVLLAVYCAIAGLLALRLLVGLFSAFALWRRATPLAKFAGSRLNVRWSTDVVSPVTIGSGIVLPDSYRNWPPTKLRAVIAHERAHVTNFDFHLQLLAGFYSALVWFSPLGWWLRRRLAVLGEAVSDRAGIAEAGTRSGYAEIVLHFAAMPRRPITGVAMACSGNITRRIDQLLNEDLYHAAFSRGRKRASIAFLLITLAIYGTSLFLRVPVARAAQGAPPLPPLPALAAQIAAPASPSAAPARPETPPPPPENHSFSVTQSHDDNSYSFSTSDNGDSYALVNGTNNNITFSGSGSMDHTHAELDKARQAAKDGKFFWFRHDGKSYVVTDPTILAELKALYAPMEDLGRQQEELGKQQEALGRQQEELGHRQEQASVSTPDLTREVNELQEAMKKLQAMQGKDTTQEQLSEIQEKLGDLQGRLGELQGKIGEKQGSFGEAQGRLGEAQGKLGEQQGRLGEQQAELAKKADKQVKSVIEETLRNGKAQPVQ